MEIRQLQYFLAVAEECNFRRAAEQLHIAQPALSQQVAKFEKELGTKLFVRTTRRVDLTNAGLALLPEARRMIAQADQALMSVRKAARGELGPARIGFVSSAALTVMPTFTLALRRTWPELDIVLTEATNSEQLQHINAGSMDAGIARESQETDEIVTFPLLRERLVLALHDGHRLARRRSVRLAQLRGEPLLVVSRSRVSRFYDHVNALFEQAGLSPTTAQEAGQFPTLIGLAAANSGVAIVPESLRMLQLPHLTYLPIADATAFSTLSLMTRRDRSEDPVIGHIVDIARSLHG